MKLVVIGVIIIVIQKEFFPLFSTDDVLFLVELDKPKAIEGSLVCDLFILTRRHNLKQKKLLVCYICPIQNARAL